MSTLNVGVTPPPTKYAHLGL